MEKKTAIITGASGGIGQVIARTFAENGYHLIIAGHTAIDKLAQLKFDLESTYKISCRTFIGDLGNEESVYELYSNIEEIDVLINNAGISYVGLLSTMTLEDWNHIINTNLTSAFLCSKHAIPLMLKKHVGKIINISSVWGYTGASMEVAYSASKGGMNAFTRALAKELAPSNIQVNAIACGLIDTVMNKNLSAEELIEIIKEIPANRIGFPKDIAEIVFDLCNGKSYITGQVISVDGGWL